MFALQTLKKDGYLCLYFHPWEFTDIELWFAGFCQTTQWLTPAERLNRLIKDLKKSGFYYIGGLL